MNVFALHAPTDRAALRWIGSAAVIVAIHAGLIAAGIAWYRKQAEPGVAIPAIMIDMAPAMASPEVSTQDVAPGPEMTQADAPSEPPPEAPPQQHVEEQIPPTPLMEKPAVEAPPEQKVEPTPPSPEPAKVTPEPPKPTPDKPKPVRAEVKKKPSEAPAAPKTTAAPRSERRAPAQTAASSGAAAAAAMPSYRAMLAAHLQRYKQYPSEAKSAGRTGVATISFTVSRNGQVLASRLAGSSGVPALDAETMAMIRRAQPLPAFPPEITQASMSFTVPIRFSLDR